MPTLKTVLGAAVAIALFTVWRGSDGETPATIESTAATPNQP